MANYVTITSDKKRSEALRRCKLGLIPMFGFAGWHYFYVGRIGKGILYLLTMGLFWLGTFKDLYKISQGTFTDNTGTPLHE